VFESRWGLIFNHSLFYPRCLDSQCTAAQRNSDAIGYSLETLHITLLLLSFIQARYTLLCCRDDWFLFRCIRQKEVNPPLW